MVNDIGQGTQVFMDGVDLTSMLNKASLAAPADAKQTTVFRPPGYAHTFIAGLNSATLGLSGPQPMSKAEVARMVKISPLTRRAGQDILVAAGGADVGNLALICQSLETSWKTEAQPDGVIMLNADFQVTAGSPGLCAGTIIYTPNGSTSITQAERQVLTLLDAVSAGTINDGSGLAGGAHNFTVTPGDSAGTVQAAARALSAKYASVVVTGSSTAVGGTVTVSDAGTSAYNGDYTVLGYNVNGSDQSQGYSFVKTGGTSYYIFFADGYWYMGPTTPGYGGSHGNNHYYAPGIINVVPASGWLNAGGPTSPAPTTTSVSSEGAGSGTYTFDFPASAGSVPLMTTATPGYDATRTRIGGTTTSNNVVSGTGNGTAVRDYDLTTVTTHGGECVVHTNQVAGTPSLTMKLQHAPNSAGSPGTWADLGSPITATNVGANRISIPDGTTVNPFIRLVITAITGTHVIAAAWARRF